LRLSTWFFICGLWHSCTRITSWEKDVLQRKTIKLRSKYGLDIRLLIDTGDAHKNRANNFGLLISDT
jgi:hypothetical protein